MPPHKEIKRCKKTPTWRTSSKKSPPDNELFFSRGGGVEGRKLTLPPPPMRATMSILYIFLKRMFSENVLQDAPN